MASNNFLVFNENKKNMLSDTAYDSDNQRKNGLEPGMARSALMNKVLYQITTICSSIAQFLASKGYNVEENADSLYNCISDLLSSKIVDDTTSLNEGIYRNLLLNANISDDINNLALGKKTLYNFTHGLGYAFIYQANITDDTDVNALKKCDNRYQIANDRMALGFMAKYDILAKQWRENEFLSLGKRKLTETVICNAVDSSSPLDNTYESGTIIKIPNTNKMILSSKDKDYSPHYSIDGGKTWARMPRTGYGFFSSDYKYWYIYHNERSDGGTSWMSGTVDDFATSKGSGNLTLKYGDIYSTKEFGLFESEGSYWLFANREGGTVYAWAEAYIQSNPLNLSVSGTANFHSGIGYDRWNSVYKVGNCILAIWSGKTASSNETGEYDVGLLLIKGNQIIKNIRDSVDYASYGTSAGFNLSVQFDSFDTTDICYVRVNIYSGGSDEVRKYYKVDGVNGTITEITSKQMPYPISWNTRYNYLLPTNTEYKCVVDSEGYIVNDNMDFGFNYPSPLVAKKIKAINIKGIGSGYANGDSYINLHQYIIENLDPNENKFIQYYFKNNQIIKSEQYLSDINDI